jgi:uncharacterized protein YfbU (UPF0304 family)
VTPETLTAFERLQLINQLRILEKVDPNNAEDYAESRGIIAHGYAIQYEDVFNEVHECHAALKSRIVAHKTRTKFLLKFVRDISTQMTLTLLACIGFCPGFEYKHPD